MDGLVWHIPGLKLLASRLEVSFGKTGIFLRCVHVFNPIQDTWAHAGNLFSSKYSYDWSLLSLLVAPSESQGVERVVTSCLTISRRVDEFRVLKSQNWPKKKCLLNPKLSICIPLEWLRFEKMKVFSVLCILVYLRYRNKLKVALKFWVESRTPSEGWLDSGYLKGRR